VRTDLDHAPVTRDSASPRFSGRGRLLFHNTLYTASASALWQVLAFVSLPMLLATVGTADFGIYGLAAASLGYFSILSLPARQSVAKFVAEYGTDDHDRIQHLFNSAMVLNFATGILIALGLGLAAIHVDSLFNFEPEGVPRARALLFAYAGAALIIQPLSVFASIMYGIQAYRPIAAYDALGAITRFSVIVAIYVFGGNIFWFAAHELLFEVFRGLVLRRAVRKRFPALTIHPRFARMASLRTIVTYGGWSLLYALALLLIYQGNRVLVGVVLSVSAITYFHISYMLFNLVNTMASYLRNAVLPSSSAAMAAGDHDFVNRLMYAGTKITLSVMLPVCLHLIVFSDSIIANWMGTAYIDATANLSRILIASWLFILPTFLLVHVYWAQKEIAPLSIAALVGALAQIALMVYLAGPWGLEGVAAATALYFALLAPVQLWIIARKLAIPIRHFLAVSLLPSYAVNLIYAAGLALVLRELGTPASLPVLLLSLAASIGLNIAINFLTVSRGEGSALLYRARDTGAAVLRTLRR
jgi:O-antigen/teichoic acid export membrane protein